MKNSKNNRRKRRTNEDVQSDLLNAAEQLIKEKGFKNIAITEIMKKADVEPSVVYKRFKDLDDLFDKYVRKHDYWFHDLIEAHIEEKHPISSMKNILEGLTDTLYENKVIRQILSWEITDKNKTTCWTAQSRELQSEPLLKYFRKNMPQTIDFDCLIAIIIGGIYYAVLHKDVSTFCSINFDDEKGKSLLLKTIKQIIDCVYSQEISISEESIRQQEKIRMAQALYTNKVDMRTIEKVTGLTFKDLR
ncbi:TetR/AcrR family transcriptional regulator [Dysgonomonas sp. 511]|uniref:TetR/AcrR family transcriptional regulator n=1 Tax=Dysgonomonas sp. 511 TaxID=2302930 RepID=UPI0013D7D846|nr:TetR/AcrR family transcriptional regulator [Dysgonomonas sp. 511]NDV78491.1 TetR/AcrR family transcriptional regulator [Dysgonomonas sp. 511]